MDDDEDFLEAAQALLEGDGVTVAGVAHSSAEAVQRARALRPDVVLIDIRLGRESGFEAARRLAGNGHSAALIIAFWERTDLQDSDCADHQDCG